MAQIGTGRLSASDWIQAWIDKYFQAHALPCRVHALEMTRDVFDSRKMHLFLALTSELPVEEELALREAIEDAWSGLWGMEGRVVLIIHYHRES